MPEPVRALIAGALVEPIWRNEAGGLTVRLTTPDAVRYLKWSPAGGPDLRAEATRLVWAGRFATVPEVLDQGHDPSGQWLVTAAVPGRSAVDPRWLAEPARAAAAVGTGLRALHDALPTAGCPFGWSARDRVAAASALLDRGAVPTSAEHRGLAAAEVRARLADVPDLDAVVCHGDACVPNTLVDDDGSCSAHVDLGALGVADRWADLAVAAWSTVWNYGPGHERTVYDAYEVEPDPAKESYYRLLWAVS